MNTHFSKKSVLRSIITSFVFSATLLQASSIFAGPPRGVPECLANGQGALPFMNEQVLQWKRETPNQFQSRALVYGEVVSLIKKRATHTHVKVKLDEGKRDTIEVIYNNAFGGLPRIQAGMVTEVCGDYITARSKAGPYPPSPEGAIIHWVHINSRGGDHESGFFRIDGVVYGNRPSEVDGGRGFNLLEYFLEPELAAPAFY